jgi:prepilin-type N-terminal cleavage/methylation domain-containing protein
MFINRKKNRGFSIIEMVIVVFVITMGLLGLSSVVIQNIAAQNLDKNTLVASGLAQEGIELVRQKRDNNWLLSQDWNDGLGEGAYIANYRNGLSGGGAGVDARLYYDIDGFYYTTPGVPSVFSRTITIKNNVDGSINVQSKVEWQEKNITKNYIAETNLYGWQ